MRVLGVDPGLSRCGVGVVDGTSHKASVVRAGVIRTGTDEPVHCRLARIHDELGTLIAATRPDAVAVERVFFNVNAATAIGVAQAAGIALLSAADAGLPVTEYTPTQVKAAVAGNGEADKRQVGYMVRALLGLADLPGPADVADALALGLCHLRQNALGTSSDAMPARLAAALETARPGAQVVTARGARGTQSPPLGTRGVLGGQSPPLGTRGVLGGPSLPLGTRAVWGAQSPPLGT